MSNKYILEFYQVLYYFCTREHLCLLRSLMAGPLWNKMKSQNGPPSKLDDITWHNPEFRCFLSYKYVCYMHGGSIMKRTSYWISWFVLKIHFLLFWFSHYQIISDDIWWVDFMRVTLYDHLREDINRKKNVYLWITNNPHVLCLLMSSLNVWRLDSLIM